MAIFQGKSVEEAIDNALIELNITKDQAKITVLEEAQKGFLGIGGKNAKVEVIAMENDGERASNFISGLLEMMKIPATTEILENGDKIVIDILTTSPTQVIGYRGEMLDALQTLAGATANIGNDEYKKVVVNCENYREKREETLKALAVRIANKAKKYGKKFSLEPMNPFERKVIHSALSEMEGIKTESEGAEPNRYVVVIPENVKVGNDKVERYGRGSSKKEREKNGKRDRKEKSDVIKLDKKTIGYGTFLGNSLKED